MSSMETKEEKYSNKVIASLPREKRGKVRETVKKIDENLKNMLNIIEENIVKPIKNERNIIREVLQSQTTIGRLQKHHEATHKLLTGLLTHNKKIKKKKK